VVLNGLAVSAVTAVPSGLKETWRDGQRRLSTELRLLTFYLQSVSAASFKFKKTFVKQMSATIKGAESLEWSTVLILPGVIVVASSVRCAALDIESSFSAVTVASWIYAWTAADTASDGIDRHLLTSLSDDL
jgi:hypothetical protein